MRPIDSEESKRKITMPSRNVKSLCEQTRKTNSNHLWGLHMRCVMLTFFFLHSCWNELFTTSHNRQKKTKNCVKLNMNIIGNKVTDQNDILFIPTFPLVFPNHYSSNEQCFYCKIHIQSLHHSLTRQYSQFSCFIYLFQYTLLSFCQLKLWNEWEWNTSNTRQRTKTQKKCTNNKNVKWNKKKEENKSI